MNSRAVKNVLLAGLQGRVTQWSTDDVDDWEDDKTIAEKIDSAKLALENDYFRIRVKPGQTTGGQS